jgi:uncharacterized membrane protein
MTLAGGGPPLPGAPRRVYLDWLRGVAVMIMITWHLLDSWTQVPERAHPAFQALSYAAGTFTALFLFLAGVSVSLSAGSKLRRLGNPPAAARLVAWRGLQVVGLAFLLRLQSIVLSNAPWHSMLRVDILNIMGLGIAAAAVTWGAGRSAAARYGALGGATLLIVFATPFVRAAGWLDLLPDPIEGYLRPVQPFSSFVLFPWAGFVFAGAAAGVAIDAVRERGAESRLNIFFFLAGLALAAGAFGASYLPSPYANTVFWTTSPAYFFLRFGLILAVVGVAYAWSSRPGGSRWSPVSQLGTTSLFIYWIHVEMVYGRMSAPLHKALTFPQALMALALFALFMLACSVAKTRAAVGWRSLRARRLAS